MQLYLIFNANTIKGNYLVLTNISFIFKVFELGIFFHLELYLKAHLENKIITTFYLLVDHIFANRVEMK